MKIDARAVLAERKSALCNGDVAEYVGVSGKVFSDSYNGKKVLVHGDRVRVSVVSSFDVTGQKAQERMVLVDGIESWLPIKWFKRVAPRIA